jgi:hypothetical protein
VAALVLALAALVIGGVMALRAGPREREQLRARTARDGFLYREKGSWAIHVVQAGARFLVPSPQEFNALGYRWDAVEVVPPGAVAHLRPQPADGALLQERGSSTMYWFDAGRKRAIESKDQLAGLGFQAKDVKIVPAGSLAPLPAGPPVK